MREINGRNGGERVSWKLMGNVTSYRVETEGVGRGGEYWLVGFEYTEVTEGNG